MSHQPYKVDRESAEKLIVMLKKLPQKGWEANLRNDGRRVDLRKEDNSNLYCPLTAACLEFKNQDLSRRKDTDKAGEILGFDSDATWGIAAAADRGVNVGDRFTADWGYSKTLRLKILKSLKLIPWYRIDKHLLVLFL